MRVRVLQHVPFEGPGSIRHWAETRGHELSITDLSSGDPLPQLEDVDSVIAMGGPMNVDSEDEHPWLVDEKRFLERAIDSGKLVVGICLGAQLLARVLGAPVTPTEEREIGWFPVTTVDGTSELTPFRDFPETETVFHWHGDSFELPSGAVHLARSEACENQAFLYEERVLGLQFHLELTREVVSRLVEHCFDELVDAPWIQKPAVMLAADAPFERVHELMRGVLDRLHGAG